MTNDEGRSAIRMTVSLVSYGTPESVMTAGMTGRAPVAMTIWSPVTSSS